MSNEELTKPRYKVIAPDTSGDFEVGEIFTLQFRPNNGNVYGIEIFGTPGIWDEAYFEKYPHIFKRLEWWHLRNGNDMPKFIGVKDESGKFRWVHKVVRWDELRVEEQGYCTISFTNLQGVYEERGIGIYGTSPATETEYLNHKNKSNA